MTRLCIMENAGRQYKCIQIRAIALRSPTMPHQESDRMAQVQTPMIPVVGEWVAQHPGTISLGQGIVHYPAPAAAHKAALLAMENSQRVDRYTLVCGIDELLEQVEQKVRAENGIDTEAQSCVVTAGSNMGFLNAIMAVADVNDEVILLSPYYFNHEMAIEMAGCRAVIVQTDSEYQVDLPAIEAAMTSRTRAVVTVSPGNPTGALFPRESLMAVNELCRARGIYHISDEAYEYFIYGGKQYFSPGSLPHSAPYTISLFTLSKAYGMAGWRIGYMTIPKHLEVAVKKAQDTNLVCPPVITQFAAAAAMKEGAAWCAQQITGFEHVRDLVLNELSKLGERCEVPTPHGAFYALIKLNTNKSDMEIVELLIREYGIAVMPGCTFGITDGCSLRLAFGALDAETVAEGVGRLTHGLTNIL